METQQVHDAKAFYAAVEAHLLRDEVVNNLIIGIASSARYGQMSSLPLMLAAWNGATVVGAALMTAPYNLILSQLAHPDAAAAIATYCAEHAIAPPGVVGTVEDSARFADAWATRSGQAARLATPQRLYRLDRVTPPQDVDGRFRIATADDTPILLDWIIDFNQEALQLSTTTEQAQSMVTRFLTSPPLCFAVWDVDGIPVSMAAINRVTPHGANIAYVYTPHDQRRKGYGAAVTAALSQHALHSGREFCTLYTDLANATTNHIYQAMGYTPVIDASDWRFG
jgi:uncharacterized protein